MSARRATATSRMILRRAKGVPTVVLEYRCGVQITRRRPDVRVCEGVILDYTLPGRPTRIISLRMLDRSELFRHARMVLREEGI